MLLNEIFDGDMAYLAKASQYAKARWWSCPPLQARGAALQQRRQQFASTVCGCKCRLTRAQFMQHQRTAAPALSVAR